MTTAPNPKEVFPNKGIKQICYIKNIVKNPNIIVGDYTYYDDKDGSESFESHVTHHYDFIGDKLIIGKFCAIGQGVEFIMNGANHRMNSVSTYPFNIMMNGWEKSVPSLDDYHLKETLLTIIGNIIGNDVWIGQNVTIMPGVHIGDGAIIAANSVVSKNISAYNIAGGNPVKIIRKRFDDDLIAYLEKLQWWNWSSQKITDNLDILCSAVLSRIREILD